MSDKPLDEFKGFHSGIAEIAANVTEVENDTVPIVDSAGYLPCGCHGSQRDHSCGTAAADDAYDDDGDEEEPISDPGSFDGGYGYGSYFHQAMNKND